VGFGARQFRRLPGFTSLSGRLPPVVWREFRDFPRPKEIIDALIDARKRGVDVRVILDPSEARVNDKAHQRLNSSGVPARWFVPDRWQLLHAKWSVTDTQHTDIGSANWTFQALDGAGERADGSRPSRARRNHEASVHVKNEQVASRFEQQFLDDWQNRTR